MINSVVQEASLAGSIYQQVNLSGNIEPLAKLSGNISVPKVYYEETSAPATKDTLGLIKVGNNLTITEDGLLSVDVAIKVEEDNTRPITSAAVNTLVGNIDALLSTI